MVLPVDLNSSAYMFYKTQNNDVKLVSNKFNEWDVCFENGDWVNVSGIESLVNACIIAIMTRFNEIDIITYEDFGCRVHELIKANKNKNMLYNMEIFITDVLENIRRIKKVNWVVVTDNPDNNFYNYRVNFNVVALSDEDIEDEEEIIEEEFML